MKALVTGSSGLVGSACVELLARRGALVVGIDNDMRGQMFGGEASTLQTTDRLTSTFKEYRHLSGDLRNKDVLEAASRIFDSSLDLVVHCASQPSHEWAAEYPMVDFDINARATLQLMCWCLDEFPSAVVVYLSTNKVYGDFVNRLVYEELETRWEPVGTYFRDRGMDETVPIDDGAMHSLFGVSKLAGDLIVQEFGNYYDMCTYCLRCGCLTGHAQMGVEQHGFLSYLARCFVREAPYTVYGYVGKQVRDNLSSLDVASAVWNIYDRPSQGGHVYNLGGGRENSISLMEATNRMGKLTGKSLHVTYNARPRRGDHRWWITDTTKFCSDFPEWYVTQGLDDILEDVVRGAA